VQLFAEDREVIRRLQPIVDVGLDYVKLGQPVPTLSGGEAQRLKLAGFLAEAALGPAQAPAKKGTLFLFDEPTTGLHFDDIAKLMRSLRRLLEAGHSLIVIEHNLDVIRSADWLIDLGPEGGEAGGELVGVGTPEDLKLNPRSHTGRALRDYEETLGFERYAAAEIAREKSARYAAVDDAGVAALAEAPGRTPCGRGRPQPAVAHARAPPRERAAAQRGDPHRQRARAQPEVARRRHPAREVHRRHGRLRLGQEHARVRHPVQRGPAPLPRIAQRLRAQHRAARGAPEVDAVYGIPPTVAIEQRLSRGGRKSTVATTTEVWHFLRLLWVKLGIQHCINDGSPVRPQSVESIAAQLLRDHRGQHVGLLAPLVVNRKGVYTDLAKWAKARGHTHLRVDGEFVKVDPWPRLDRFKEHTLELPVGDLVIAPEHEDELRALLAKALDQGKGVMHLLAPLDGLTAAMESGRPTLGIGAVKVFSTKRACPTCGTSYPEPDPRMFSYNSKHGWCPGCVGTGLALTREQRKAFDDSIVEDKERGREQGFATSEPEPEELGDQPCPECHGARLAAAPRAIRFEDEVITDVAQWAVSDVRAWIEGLRLSGRDAEVARDVVSEIRSRLVFLEDVGLNYLTLDRAAPTLSGGEAQRIRLAAQLGSNLQGVCYVLDEPTIGLHPRDNRILLDALGRLGAQGNTLVVVEHDEDTIRRADHLIDIGPGAGKRGGRLVAQGTAADLSAVAESVTGRSLAHPQTHPMQRGARSRSRPTTRARERT
jgi:excinuclease ABC subunit A